MVSKKDEQEEKKTYTQHKCPGCKHESLGLFSREQKKHVIIHGMQCHNCGKTWTEHYELQGAIIDGRQVDFEGD